MKQYTQLNQEQRYHISGLSKSGWNQTQIAAEVGVNKSTISREFSRNKGQRGWRPKQAQSMRDERRQTSICVFHDHSAPNSTRILPPSPRTFCH